jgi:hypothetical protein
MWARSDGSAPPQMIFESKQALNPEALTPDGRTLIYVQRDAGLPGNLMSLAMDMTDRDHPKTGTPKQLLTLTETTTSADVSPDGRWLAYGSHESGRSEVVVRSFPDLARGGKWQVSTDGGSFPRWSASGKELLYSTPMGQIMAVEYRSAGDAFVSGTPRLWTQTPIDLEAAGTNASLFDVSPDGTRVLTMLPAARVAEGSTLHINVMLNFADELRRRLK